MEVIDERPPFVSRGGRTDDEIIDASNERSPSHRSIVLFNDVHHVSSYISELLTAFAVRTDRSSRRPTSITAVAASSSSLHLCIVIIIMNGKSVIIRPHRSTTYVDAAYSYRPSSVVCRSVRWSVCHTSEPCKNGCTDRAAVWVEDLGGPGELY